MTNPIFNFGWDEAAQEFILWKRGRSTPVARVPRQDAVSLAATVAHVERVLPQVAVPLGLLEGIAQRLYAAGDDAYRAQIEPLIDAARATLKPPVRLCCSTRHYGVTCPDNTFMCELCFDKFPVTDAWQDDKGQAWNLCKPCKALDDGVGQ